jgi:protein-arginine kinase activator protein McsA
MSAQRWKCERCGDTYDSPIAVEFVTCKRCSSRLGQRLPVLMAEADE